MPRKSKNYQKLLKNATNLVYFYCSHIDGIVCVKQIDLGLARTLSGPPRVSQSGVELEKIFECGFMASDDAYGSYKTYGKVRLKFRPP